MNFSQTIIVALLSGTFGGIVGVFLNNIFKTRQSRIQKQQQLYGKLMGLKSALASTFWYTAWAVIDFTYWKRYLQLSDQRNQPLIYKEMKMSQRLFMEQESRRSITFAELCETLGLIWATYPKNTVLDGRIKRCLAIKLFHVGEPKEIQTKDALDEWKDEKENSANTYIDAEIKIPLDSLISYMHNIVARKHKVKCD